MIEHVKSIDQYLYLYHYTTIDTALNYILKDNTIMLNNYTKTNDPKETKNWSFNLGTNKNADFSKYNMTEMSLWLSKELKEKTKVLCFSMDSLPLTGSHLKDIYNRGYSKSRMWSQYADNHKGVCLVFDKKKITKLINNYNPKEYQVISGPIVYCNRSIVPNLSDPNDQQYMINIDLLEEVGNEKYIQVHLRQHFQRLFFEKVLDWSNEVEWRFVMFTNTKERVFINIEDSLSGIMFGDCTSSKDIEKVMAITEGKNLRYMGLKWKNCSPWYDYESMHFMPKWGKS